MRIAPAFLALALALAVPACSDGTSAATSDAGPASDAAPTVDATAPPDASDASVDPVARGKYLVDVVIDCGNCHTPTSPTGEPDMSRYLAGVDCLLGEPHGGDGGLPGCLNSRNLTSDATGLKNRTDTEIRDMFQKGMRPNGESLNPFMPYWVLSTLTDDDASAIVAYLRTVPPVAHDVRPSETPWSPTPQPSPPIDPKQLPGEGDGKYLATLACLNCHTPDAPPGSAHPVDLTRPFAGGRSFPGAVYHIPSPPFPAVTYSQNLTSDATGLAGYQPSDIRRELHDGKDRDGGTICPPMPAGKAAFANLRDQDVTDIATYVLALPPIANARPSNCVAP